MPNPTRPATYPDWALTGTRTNPGSSAINTGYAPNFRPPAEWHNWQFGFIGDWLRWLDFVTQTLTSVITSATTAAAPTVIYLANANSGGFALTLPLSASNLGYRLTVKNIGTSNNVTVTRQGGDLIEAQTTYPLAPGDSITLVADGSTGWWQLQ